MTLFLQYDTTLLSSCWLYKPICDRHYTWQRWSIHRHARCIKIHPESNMFSISRKQHLNFEHFLSLLEDRVILHFRHTVGGYVTADCRVTITYTLKLVIDIILQPPRDNVFDNQVTNTPCVNNVLSYSEDHFSHYMLEEVTYTHYQSLTRNSQQ